MWSYTNDVYHILKYKKHIELISIMCGKPALKQIYS